jgi:hypothetical protein
MAISSYSNAWKNCATCVSWRGERTTNEDKTQALVKQGLVGNCDGFWQGLRKYPNDKCPEWKKWPELADWSGEIHTTYP